MATTAMTADEILAYLDEVSARNWMDFGGISAFEYHALRLVVLCEHGTDDWGLVFDKLAGSWIDDDHPRGLGIAMKIYGPSVPSYDIDVPLKRPTAFAFADGVATGPAGALAITPALLAELDLHPDQICNNEEHLEDPAAVMAVRAYIARHPGVLFGAPVASAAALRGTERDILFVTDAFEHVLGPGKYERDPALARFEILPSESETYRSLARAIVARDASLFVPGASNLDWRRWARRARSQAD